MLIGSDVKLNSPSSLIGQALTDILQHPEGARDALRVLLHLVRGLPGPVVVRKWLLLPLPRFPWGMFPLLGHPRHFGLLLREGAASQPGASLAR